MKVVKADTSIKAGTSVKDPKVAASMFKQRLRAVDPHAAVDLAVYADCGDGTGIFICNVDASGIVGVTDNGDHIGFNSWEDAADYVVSTFN